MTNKFYRLSERVNEQRNDFSVSVEEVYSPNQPEGIEKMDGSDALRLTFFSSRRQAMKALESAVDFQKMLGRSQTEMSLTF